MSALLLQQQALLEALFDWPAEPAEGRLEPLLQAGWERGLKAYQTNGHELACRALLAAYPVVGALLGEESFRSLARAYWHAQPPVRGDLAQWGGGVGRFMREGSQLEDEPYLPDVAAVEWALHCCATSADRLPDHASFALLTTAEPATLTLDLVPDCTVVSSRWPVASIVRAHLSPEIGLHEAGARVRAGRSESAVVWRAGLHPRVREAEPGEPVFLNALLAGQSLVQALDAAPNLDFNTWLPGAVQNGLLLGVQAWPRSPTS